MTIFAPGSFTARQCLIKGSLREAVTGRPLAPRAATLTFQHGAGQGTLPVALVVKPGGHFALQLNPGRAMPDLTGNGPVTLQVTLELAGGSPLAVSQIIPEAQLALVDRAVTVATHVSSARVVSGAPFAFDAVAPLSPVGLRGIVLKKQDPDQPLANVSVKAGALAAVLTAANGRFAIPALPLAQSIDLVLQGAGQPVTIAYRPDYQTPVNTVTLSLAG